MVVISIYVRFRLSVGLGFLSGLVLELVWRKRFSVNFFVKFRFRVKFGVSIGFRISVFVIVRNGKRG